MTYFVKAKTNKSVIMKFSIIFLFLICLSTKIDAQINDTLFYWKTHYKTFSVGEVFYIGHQSIRIDNYKNIETIPTEDVFRISFQNKSSDLAKDWEEILNIRKLAKDSIQKNKKLVKDIANEKIVEPEKGFIEDKINVNEITKSKIDYQILNTTYKAEIKYEMSLAASYLNKSANNQRNMVVFSAMSGLFAVGWASQAFKVVNGGEPKGMTFFQTMTIGCSLGSMISHFMSISNLKQSSVHLEAASQYMGLSMVVPIR